MSTEKEKEEEESSRGFKVRDRRRFLDPDAETASAEGADAAREEPAPAPAASSAPPDTAAAAAAATDALPPSPAPSRAGSDAQAAAGPMTFSTFIIGLMTQTLMHFGEVVDPEQQTPRRDLGAAQQMIDLLGILQDKTKGNLDPAERQLLDDMLYDLRMRYVKVSRG